MFLVHIRLVSCVFIHSYFKVLALCDLLTLCVLHVHVALFVV